MLSKMRGASQRLLPPERRSVLTDVGLLLGRASVGLMMAGHGYTKLANFEAYSAKFMDFLGLGSTISLSLAIFAEFFCSILLMLGLFTRFAALNLAFTMVVAAFVAHGADPFEKKEKALLYLTAYVLLFLTGPGRLALDRLLFKQAGNEPASGGA